MDFVYVLRIFPGGAHGSLSWSMSFSRPPTTTEVVRHIEHHASITAADFARDCIWAVQRLGVPANYRAGSQGAQDWYCNDNLGCCPPHIDLALMRHETLPVISPESPAVL
jgi:hypothetical protein